jgi:hypothetical protein
MEDSSPVTSLYQKYVLAPSASSTLLKKSPLLCSKDSSSSSLLAGGYSHYNQLKNYKRPPNKYDHFHDKTFIDNFIPTFQVSRFLNMTRKGERLIEISSEAKAIYPSRRVYQPEKSASLLQELRAPIEGQSSASLLRPGWASVNGNTKKLPTLQKSMMKSVSQPQVAQGKPRHKSIKHVRTWRVLCVEDGSHLESDSLSYYEFDLQDLYNRYIRGITPKHVDPEAKQITLKSQAMQELVETVSDELNEPFTTVFMVNGDQVTDLSEVPRACRVLLFSETGVFKGLASARLKAERGRS